MDAAPPTADLVAAVREAPTPEARAALLGVDFGRLIRTAGRLRFWALLVCGVPALILFVGEEAMVDIRTRAGELDAHVGIIAGVVLVVGFTVLAYLVAMLVGSALSRPLGLRQATVVAMALYALLDVVALYLAVRIAGTGPVFLGAIDGALIAPMVQVFGALSLPVVLRRNHPQAVEVVRTQQAEPPWQTLLGGRVRWIIAALAVSIVFSESALVVFEYAPYDLAPIAMLAVASSLVAHAVSRRGSARVWLAVQLGTAAILVAVALMVAS